MRMHTETATTGQKQDEDPIEYLVGGIPADLDILVCFTPVMPKPEVSRVIPRSWRGQ